MQQARLGCLHRLRRGETQGQHAAVRAQRRLSPAAYVVELAQAREQEAGQVVRFLEVLARRRLEPLQRLRRVAVEQQEVRFVIARLGSGYSPVEAEKKQPARKAPAKKSTK